MRSKHFLFFFSFVAFSSLFVVPSPASADWIRAEFDTGFSYTTPDGTCPGAAKSRDSYAGSGTAILNAEDAYGLGGTRYPVNIVYSSCNGLGTWVTGGLFTVISGAAGAFSGTFDGNYLKTPYGSTYDDGEFFITSQTGVFSNLDFTGFFDMSSPNGGSQEVLLYTPEPEAAGLALCGILLLALLSKLLGRALGSPESPRPA